MQTAHIHNKVMQQSVHFITHQEVSDNIRYFRDMGQYDAEYIRILNKLWLVTKDDNGKIIKASHNGKECSPQLVGILNSNHNHRQHAFQIRRAS